MLLSALIATQRPRVRWAIIAAVGAIIMLEVVWGGGGSCGGNVPSGK